MARRTPRPQATHEKTLTPLKEHCENCGHPLWVANHGHRTVMMLSGLWKLTLVIRQCIDPTCPRFHQRYRPEEEGRWALPHGEFGLEVIALIGQWRFREHRSVPEMHQAPQSALDLLASDVPPKFARPSFTHGFPGSAFTPQPDGTLLCPAGHPLYVQERRPERNGSLRVLYAARIGHCRPCPLREQCQESGSTRFHQESGAKPPPHPTRH